MIPYLVMLKVPALDLLVQRATEHVRVARTHSQPRHLLDVARKGQLQLSTCRVPELDGTVSTSSHKPVIAGVKGYAAYPADAGIDKQNSNESVSQPSD